LPTAGRCRWNASAGASSAHRRGPEPAVCRQCCDTDFGNRRPDQIEKSRNRKSGTLVRLTATGRPSQWLKEKRSADERRPDVNSRYRRTQKAARRAAFRCPVSLSAIRRLAEPARFAFPLRGRSLYSTASQSASSWASMMVVAHPHRAPDFLAVGGLDQHQWSGNWSRVYYQGCAT